MPDYIMLRDLQAPREKRLSTLHGGGVSLDGRGAALALPAAGPPEPQVDIERLDESDLHE